jgi:hypothetical protein
MSTQPSPATEAELARKAPQPSERPVNARAAAEFLQMHVRSVMRLAGMGHLPGHPIGYRQRKKWLFYIHAPRSPGVVKAREDRLPGGRNVVERSICGSPNWPRQGADALRPDHGTLHRSTR